MPPAVRVAISGLATLLGLFLVWANVFSFMSDMLRNMVYLGVVLVIVFLSGARGQRKDFFTAYLPATVAVAASIYAIAAYNSLAGWRLPVPTKSDLVFGLLLLVVLLEATRRTVGPWLPALAVLSLLYIMAGHALPGIFAHPGISVERLIFRLYLTGEGVWGIPLSVASTFIFLFLLFAALLERCGIAEWLMDAARLSSRSFRSGPALMAVIGSALTGMINGSAAANVVTTGSVTIPLMKRAGYPAHVAGAIEAAASTGGMFTPPIMGAAAFIMAAFLSVPYAEVMRAAAVPALLYYWAVGIRVILMSQRYDLSLTQSGTDVSWRSVFKRSYLVLPIVVLVLTLLTGRSVMFAAFAGIVALLVLNAIVPGDRLGVGGLRAALESAVTGGLQIAALTATAGILINLFTVTGLGSTLARHLMTITAGIDVIALGVIMVLAIFLSTGLPATALYIVLVSVLAAPMRQLGVHDFGAHLFILWWGVLGNVTPPVAIAGYTAAALAGSPPTKTALQALLICLPAFVVPFSFALDPGLLLMETSFFSALSAAISAAAGTAAAAAGLEGCLLWRMNAVSRGLLIVGGAALILPGTGTRVFGVLAIAVGLAWTFVRDRSLPVTTSVT